MAEIFFMRFIFSVFQFEINLIIFREINSSKLKMSFNNREFVSSADQVALLESKTEAVAAVIVEEPKSLDQDSGTCVDTSNSTSAADMLLENIDRAQLTVSSVNSILPDLPEIEHDEDEETGCGSADHKPLLPLPLKSMIVTNYNGNTRLEFHFTKKNVEFARFLLHWELQCDESLDRNSKDSEKIIFENVRFIYYLVNYSLENSHQFRVLLRDFYIFLKLALETLQLQIKKKFKPSTF